MKIIRIASNSMKPILNKGELILLRKIEGKKIHTGDIVGFVLEEEGERKIPLIHRVIKKDHNLIFTASDIGRAYDYPHPIKITAVMGKIGGIKINGVWKRSDRIWIARSMNYAIAAMTRIVIHFPRFSPAVKLRKLLTRLTRVMLEMNGTSRFRLRTRKPSYKGDWVG